jgi:hypothetical protein
MLKEIQLMGFEKQKVEVETGGVIMRTTLLIDGKLVQEGFWGKFTLMRDDGTRVNGKWKSRVYGLDIPDLVVEDTTYKVVDPNPFYAIVWSALPVFLYARDFFWGTIFSLVAVYVNLHIFHFEWKTWIKFLVTGAISLGWVGLFFLLEPIILGK